MSACDGNGRVIVGSGWNTGLVERGDFSNRGERVVVGGDNRDWDTSSGTWKTDAGFRSINVGGDCDDRDTLTKVCDFITGWQPPERKWPDSVAHIKLTNEEINSRALMKSFGVSDVVAKRDRSNDRSAVDLARDVYSATESASARDWPSAAYYSTEVARDLIDVGRATGEDFVESRTEAVQGGYSEYSDIGFQ
jgi:hypothetical protein